MRASDAGFRVYVNPEVHTGGGELSRILPEVYSLYMRDASDLHPNNADPVNNLQEACMFAVCNVQTHVENRDISPQ